MSRKKEKIELGEVTRETAKKRFKKFPLAILPVGSCEQHGPHLPLDTDAYDAHYVATEAANLSKSPKPLVLPTLPYGISLHHLGFCGTVSLTPQTFINLVFEIAESVKLHGVKALVVVNGHGGNTASLIAAGQMIKHRLGMEFYIYEGWSGGHKRFGIPGDVHAGGFETSTSLAIRPHLVDREAIPQPVKSSFPIPQTNFSAEEHIGFAFNTDELSKTGVLGDATKIDIEKGKEFWKRSIENLVAILEELRKHLLRA
ncbi:MAG: creatininase family protein [Planctomycetota bacterium]|nr:creatininase family protein [Planctomycetota bacterium]